MKVYCPGCGGLLTMPDELSGKHVSCSICKQQFVSSKVIDESSVASLVRTIRGHAVSWLTRLTSSRLWSMMSGRARSLVSRTREDERPIYHHAFGARLPASAERRLGIVAVIGIAILIAFVAEIVCDFFRAETPPQRAVVNRHAPPPVPPAQPARLEQLAAPSVPEAVTIREKPNAPVAPPAGTPSGADAEDVAFRSAMSSYGAARFYDGRALAMAEFLKRHPSGRNSDEARALGMKNHRMVMLAIAWDRGERILLSSVNLCPLSRAQAKMALPGTMDEADAMLASANSEDRALLLLVRSVLATKAGKQRESEVSARDSMLSYNSLWSGYMADSDRGRALVCIYNECVCMLMEQHADAVQAIQKSDYFIAGPEAVRAELANLDKIEEMMEGLSDDSYAREFVGPVRDAVKAIREGLQSIDK